MFGVMLPAVDSTDCVLALHNLDMYWIFLLFIYNLYSSQQQHLNWIHFKNDFQAVFEMAPGNRLDLTDGSSSHN